MAAVATGFPSGQFSLKTRLEEIRLAVESGAREIDIVINRKMALNHQWKDLYEEVKEMKKACGSAHMKSILAVGELGSMNNVYKASLVCMMAGSDFIKTSTGKEGVNATLSVGLVMCRFQIDANSASKILSEAFDIISEPFAIITSGPDLSSDSNRPEESEPERTRAPG